MDDETGLVGSLHILSKEYSAGFEAACAINASADLMHSVSRTESAVRELERANRFGALTKYELKTILESTEALKTAARSLSELAIAITTKATEK